MLVESCVINNVVFKRGDRIEELGDYKKIIKGVFIIGKILIKDDYKVVHYINSKGVVTLKTERVYDDNEFKHAVLCHDNIYRSSVEFEGKIYVCDNKRIEAGSVVLYLNKKKKMNVGVITKDLHDKCEVNGEILDTGKCFSCYIHSNV
jgi:hypothetical protein